MDATGQNTHRSALLDGNSGTQWEGIMERNALGRGGRNLLHGERVLKDIDCVDMSQHRSLFCAGAKLF